MDPLLLALSIIGILIFFECAESKCRKKLRQRDADLRLSKAETALVTRRRDDLSQQHEERTIALENVIAQLKDIVEQRDRARGLLEERTIALEDIVEQRDTAVVQLEERAISLDQVFKQRNAARKQRDEAKDQHDEASRMLEFSRREVSNQNKRVIDLERERDNARENLIASEDRAIEHVTEGAVLRTTIEELEASLYGMATERNGLREELQGLREEAVANDITGNVYGEDGDQKGPAEEIANLRSRLKNHEDLFKRADTHAAYLERQIEDRELEKLAAIEQSEVATVTIEGLRHRLSEAKRRKGELEIAYKNVLQRPERWRRALTRDLENEGSRAFWDNVDKSDAQILLLPQWQQDIIQKRDSK